MPEGQDLEISPPGPLSAAASLLAGKSGRQVVLFLIVGISNTIFTYVVYLALLRVVYYAWAFTGAFLVGLIFTGLMNIRVTFGHHPTVVACVVFSAYYLLYYVFALFLLHTLIDGLGLDEHFAPLAMLPIVVPINFVMTRFIVHRFGRALPRRHSGNAECG
jgi:putative flippase GtrA